MGSSIRAAAAQTTQRPEQSSASTTCGSSSSVDSVNGQKQPRASSSKRGPSRLPESGGICIYEGRLKDLAEEVKKEIPIKAVIGSLPRPNQAFWTLSALWAGWLWGREAVEPYKPALRRRRYDWAWNATASNAAFTHLFGLLPSGHAVLWLADGTRALVPHLCPDRRERRRV